jgi:hypothetical protein
MNFDNFLKQAWKNHAKDPHGVAKELDNGISLIESNEHISKLVQIIGHDYTGTG